MSFKKCHRLCSEAAARQMWLGRQNFSQFRFDRNPRLVAYAENILKLRAPAIDSRAHHARRVTRSLLIHPCNDVDGPARTHSGSDDRLDALQALPGHQMRRRICRRSAGYRYASRLRPAASLASIPLQRRKRLATGSVDASSPIARPQRTTSTRASISSVRQCLTIDPPPFGSAPNLASAIRRSHNRSPLTCLAIVPIALLALCAAISPVPQTGALAHYQAKHRSGGH